MKAEDYEGAYNAFVELGDWKDALDYVGRFTVLENVVLEETQNLHKNLEELTSVIHYDYDSQGRVIKKTGDRKKRNHPFFARDGRRTGVFL